MAPQIQTAYFVVGLAKMANQYPVDESVEIAIANIEAASNIRIVTVPMKYSDGCLGTGMRSIVFWFGDGKADNAAAERFAESILLALHYVSGPVLEFHSRVNCLPFDVLDCGSMTEVGERQLRDGYRKYLAPNDSLCTGVNLRTYTSVVHQKLALALHLGHALLEHPRLALSLAFLVEAQRAFYVWPGGIDEALLDPDWRPTSISALVAWETSFFNTYRCVEAVVGDRPKDAAKFRSKLVAAGVDPDCMVGYRSHQPLMDVLRQMNDARDKRVAHGSTATRGVALADMVEFQECARFVLECAFVKRGLLESS